MKKNGIIFVIAFLVAFAGGYFIFSSGGDAPEKDTSKATSEKQDKKDDASDEETAKEDSSGEATVPAEAEALQANNCLSCHAVESLGAEGGASGPDLSDAYKNVKGKHGKELDEFLQEPTSQVMSGVIEGNPLSDEEREQIVEALKKASEKNE